MSREFREYLDRCDLARKREILKAERAYTDSRRHDGTEETDPSLRDFEESLSGHADTPAGKPPPNPTYLEEGLDIKLDL